MKAATANSIPAGDGWATEIKWDGMRVMADIRNSSLELWSSNGRRVTSSFPELAKLADAIGTDVTFDGEVVAFDEDRPSFGRLQRRIHVEKPATALLNDVPVALIVFDLLRLDGRSLLELDYLNRRRVLEDLLEPGSCWSVPAYSIGGADSMLQVARDKELEGIVMKRTDSLYRPGSRSKSWLKIKVRRRQEFVVGGWLEGQGGLAGRLGSLVVGVWNGSQFIVAGRVGSGLTDDERRRLEPMLTDRTNPPFAEVPPMDKPAHWVEPTVVVEVEFAEWPTEGMLRHPTYRGVRTDREADSVVRE